MRKRTKAIYKTRRNLSRTTPTPTRSATVSKPYYTLLVRVDGIWLVEFGDYDRQEVEAELEILIGDIGHAEWGTGITRKNTKIYCADSADQHGIEAAVKRLNS